MGDSHGFIALTAMLAVGTLAAACSPPTEIALPDTVLVYSGEQVRIHAAADASVCSGTGASMDEMLAYLGRETALGDLGEPVDVYLLTPDQVVDVCDLDYIETFACAFFDDVRPFVVTSYVPTEHELVHAFLSLKQRTPRARHAFFEEGFASVYGRDGVLSAPTTGLDEAISYSSQLPAEHYPRAAHFVNFVVDEFGPEATASFLLETTGTSSDEQLADVFSSAFGVSLPSTIALYEAQAPSCSSNGWQRGYNCEELPVDWHFSGTLRLDIGNSCNAASVLGEANQLTQERFVVEFPEATTLSIELDSQVEQQFPRARLVKCGSCEDEFALDYNLDDGPLSGVEIEPGKYVLTAYYPSGQPEATVLKLRRE